jgi:hypothetical protein
MGRACPSACRPVRRGVFKGVKDGSRLPALQAGHPRKGRKTVLGVTRPQAVEGSGMASPGETLGSPWIPLALRASFRVSPFDCPLHSPYDLQRALHPKPFLSNLAIHAKCYIATISSLLGHSLQVHQHLSRFSSQICLTCFAIACRTHGRMVRGGYGLPKSSLGPAMHFPSTPCGRTTPETALWLFQGWLARKAGGRLLPLWTPHAVRLCQDFAWQRGRI